jgi:hypothetical protein
VIVVEKEESMEPIDVRAPNEDVEVLPSGNEDLVRADEFRCVRCGLIVPRSHMADARLPLCPVCTKYVATTGALA